MARAMRRLVGFACVLAACLLAVVPARAFAKTQTTEPSRAIAIAYDNSGSMTKGGTDRWCNAKYSLEVIASMLNEDDTLGVYFMTEEEPLVVSGSTAAQERVRQVHERSFGRAGATPAWTVSNAYQSLRSSSAQERYLVITTDGSWNTTVDGTEDQGGAKAASEVADLMRQASAEGVHVIYLAMGEDAIAVEADGASIHKATTEGVLDEMTKVANEIFGRASLPMKAGRLDLDLPMSKLIVFAQGADVSVGHLVADGVDVTPTVATVCYSKLPYATDEDNNVESDSWKVNKKLRGVVAVYDSPLPTGSYQLDVQGAEGTPEVYYTPDVDVAVTLTNRETGASLTITPSMTDQIDAGDYTATFAICDHAGNPLTSSLISDLSCVLGVESGGHTVEVGSGEVLTLDPGDARLAPRATAGLSGSSETLTISSDYAVKVGPRPQYLDIDVSDVTGTLNVLHLDKGTGTIRVTKRDGEPFTAQEREDLTLALTCEQGLVWSDPVKTDEGDERTVVFTTATKIGPDGAKAQRKQVLRNRLFGFLFGVDVTTSADAAIASDTYPYAGHADVSTKITPDMRVVIAWWLTLAALLALIVSFIRKPRLPRLNPRLVVSGQEYELTYDHRVGHRFMLPWSPETAHFSTDLATGGRANRFHKCFMPLEIGVVAVRPVRGHRGRSFVLDDETVVQLAAYAENPGSYPDPQLKCIRRGKGKGKGGKGKSTMAWISSRFSGGSKITITGKRERGRGTEQYVIKFS